MVEINLCLGHFYIVMHFVINFLTAQCARPIKKGHFWVYENDLCTMGSDGQQIMVIKNVAVFGSLYFKLSCCCCCCCCCALWCNRDVFSRAAANSNSALLWYDFVLLGLFSVSGVPVSGSPRPLGSLDEMEVCVVADCVVVPYAGLNRPLLLYASVSNRFWGEIIHRASSLPHVKT